MPKVSEAHRAERRRQILDGSRRAFAKHGYARATVDELEAEVGLSRGAIFSYFPSKLELFVSLAELDQRRVGEVWVDEGFEAVVRLIATDPEWIAVYLEVARMLRGDEELRERWLAMNPELQASVGERLERLQAEGRLRNDLSVETIGRFLGVVLDGLVTQQGAGYGVDPDGTIELLRSALAPK